MASPPRPYAPIPPPATCATFPDNSTPCTSLGSPVSKETATRQYPVTVQTSFLPSLTHPAAFSVKTRICPAKHGIAVSLCLVDSSSTPSKDTVKDLKPIGWVTPNTWDSRFSGTEETMDVRKLETTCENTALRNVEETKKQVCEDSGHIAAIDADYIDILQANLLFGKSPSATAGQQNSAQTEKHQSELFMHLPKNAPLSSLHHSQSHHPQPETFQCVRTVQFSEKPCTPCMTRRQGEVVSQTQDLKCRHRESYKAALKNPVGLEKARSRMLGVLPEDGGISRCDDRRRPTETERGGPQWHDQKPCCESGMENFPSASGAIFKESGETHSVPCWRHTGDKTPADRTAYTRKFDRNPEPITHRTDVPFREPTDAKYYIGLQNGSRANTDIFFPCTKNPQHANIISDDHHSLSHRCSEIPKPCERPLDRPTPTGAKDKRDSSLSTAVVDTSEKCQLVLVDGQNVRRGADADTGAGVPQLHVVKCKKSTAFQLVSPKISRMKMAIPDAVSRSNDGRSLKSSSLETDTHKNPQSSSTHPNPRPDHLPLGFLGPRVHPLYQGVAALTGGRDRTGRAIIELYGDHQEWRSNMTSQELLGMLLYFHSIIRRELREAGMTLIFDARKSNPPPLLYKALMTLQELIPQAVNSLLLFIDRESSPHPETCPTIQTEVVTSPKALMKLVEESQRTYCLDGTLCHNNRDWMELHQKLFPFASDLHEASGLLLRAISNLKAPRRMDSVQTVQQCMKEQRTLMRDVLEDKRLVHLQREGGAILARLRKESDLRYPHCEDLSDAVDSLTSLYNNMEEQVHILVQSSNTSLEHLEYLLHVREMEGHVTQMQKWFYEEGERHLQEAKSAVDSGEQLEQFLNRFTAFLIEANDRRHHAMSLVEDAEHLQQDGVSYPETQVFCSLICMFKTELDDFLCRAETCSRELQIMVNVCDFCEQARTLAAECIEYLNQNQTRTSKTQDWVQNRSPVNQNQDGVHALLIPVTPTTTSALSSDTSMLQIFQDKFLQFSPDKFQEVRAQASALRGSRGMRVWNAAWLRCQEAQQLLQEKIQDTTDEVLNRKPQNSSCCGHHYVDVASTHVQTAPPSGLVVQSTPGPQHPQWEAIVSGAMDLGNRRIEADCDLIKPEEHGDAGSSRKSRSSRKEERDTKKSRARSERDAAALSQSHTVGCHWFLWGRGLRAKSQSQVEATEFPTPPEEQVRPPSCSHHGQPSCRILQEAQKFQISRHGSFCSVGSCTSNRLAVEEGGGYLCKHSSLPSGRSEGTFCLESPQESTNNALRLQRVLEELLITEREYVRSLDYILTHYLPLLDRPDIPQDLRGKRGVIFGNLQKLHDFHSHYLLPELEACQSEPAMVARCFLRHSDSFGLYALYSKNKPQSDALILHRRHDIFKRKQQELGDMMDLSSYLLRPIQRISKYSLLLQDMHALTASHWPQDITHDALMAHSPDLSCREREQADIQAAAELVRFQMRHGNDLLTMDAIQDCDVNLKEQGRLIRQDEFTVFFRKKKSIRRIFLFEDLILFSKTKRTDGNDVYVYKQSFKTSDIGMTHNAGVSGLSFEIWFRRRKSEDTYTLKASSMDLKKAWTTDLEKLLWDQAAHSRELRLQERVFMGLSRKTFMDIQPSDSTVGDQAISSPRRIPVACCSHRTVDYTRPHSIGSASTTLSQSSSSSGRGSLSPAGYAGNPSHGVENGPAGGPVPDTVLDNEVNTHHFHFHHDCERWKTLHHPQTVADITDSSEESATVFFSDSEHSFLSALGGEVVDSSSSLSSHSSKPCTSMCRMSPAVTRNKPLPHRANAQEEVSIGKSTEV
uniref:uncharacterized protein LOC131137283 isoform X2 n=1 Tax=Doryrhamphus excisus TaxID=161450 RepID=UPI0025AE3576|nr:uncharacterized protein LOC131137283 isoform X2 [Doryrhamphus excisus]